MGYTFTMRLRASPRAPRLSPNMLVLCAYGALAALAVALGWARGDDDLYHFAASTPRRLALSPLIGLSVGVALVLLTRWMVRRFSWARLLHNEFHAVLHELSARDIWLLALSSSIAEEFFFRGLLVAWIGILPSSLLFAVLHLRPERRFLPWTAMSFGVGLLLALMFVGLGDLGGPIVCHFTINLINLSFIAKTELPA